MRGGHEFASQATPESGRTKAFVEPSQAMPQSYGAEFRITRAALFRTGISDTNREIGHLASVPALRMRERL